MNFNDEVRDMIDNNDEVRYMLDNLTDDEIKIMLILCQALHEMNDIQTRELQEREKTDKLWLINLAIEVHKNEGATDAENPNLGKILIAKAFG